MSGDVRIDKEDIRREVRRRLRSMTTECRELESAKIREVIRSFQGWREAEAVLFFSPMRDEPDLLPLLDAALGEGKQVSLPRWNGGRYEPALVQDQNRDLAAGKHGIAEPGEHCPVFPGNQLDLVLVPGLAWTLCGMRLGRGEGHYDRLLNECAGIHCGVAFGEQIVEQLPMEPHDRRVQVLATSTGIWPRQRTATD